MFLTKLTIEEIREGVDSKKFSLLELNEAYEKEFNQKKSLNVSISDYWAQAKENAKHFDSIDKKPALAGIPIAIKDNYLIKGTKTTAASKVLANFESPYESFVTSNLKKAGYSMPFKSNLDEFAMGSSNEFSAYGNVVNPWILSDNVLRVPGGSSGGSAAAVAANMCLGALGTDTGGSVRQPSSFCGLVGFKPSYGRSSRRGIIAFGSSLDHPGIFTRNVQDSCYIFESMAGHDKGEATSLNAPVPELTKIKGNVKGLKIGMIKQDGLSSHYCSSLNSLKSDLEKEGAIFKEVEVPSFDLALSLYYIIAPAEVASNLARFDGIRFGVRGEGSGFEEIIKNSRNNFGAEVKRRILTGNFVLFSDEYDKYFGKALKLREELKARMQELFSEIDVLLLPTSPGVAFPIGTAQERCPAEMYKEDMYTILANMYGGPSMQVPIGKVSYLSDKPANKTSEFDFLKVQDGLPFGVQIMAACEREDLVVMAAKKVEEIVRWEGLK